MYAFLAKHNSTIPSKKRNCIKQRMGDGNDGIDDVFTTKRQQTPKQGDASSSLLRWNRRDWLIVLRLCLCVCVFCHNTPINLWSHPEHACNDDVSAKSAQDDVSINKRLAHDILEWKWKTHVEIMIWISAVYYLLSRWCMGLLDWTRLWNIQQKQHWKILFKLRLGLNVCPTLHFFLYHSVSVCSVLYGLHFDYVNAKPEAPPYYMWLGYRKHNHLTGKVVSQVRSIYRDHKYFCVDVE